MRDIHLCVCRLISITKQQGAPLDSAGDRKHRKLRTQSTKVFRFISDERRISKPTSLSANCPLTFMQRGRKKREKVDIGERERLVLVVVERSFSRHPNNKDISIFPRFGCSVRAKIKSSEHLYRPVSVNRQTVKLGVGRRDSKQFPQLPVG